MPIKLSPSVSDPQRCFFRPGQADVELPMCPGIINPEPVANAWVASHMQNTSLLTIWYSPPLSSSLQRIRNCSMDLSERVTSWEHGDRPP